MATYETNFFNRDGAVFSILNGRSVEKVDLSDLRILHAGVDTIKQLFSCFINEEIYKLVGDTESGKILNVGGLDWMVTRSSKMSGYQYILKNGDFGVVVLLKSFYKEINEHGAHLKIELSPHFIASRNPDDITKKLRFIAGIFAHPENLLESGCAVHLAVDVKGFKPGENFEKRFVCKAKREMKFGGISELSFEGLSSVAAVYGSGDTYTFGQASSLQCCIYDKIKEVKSSDKLSFWSGIWSSVPSVNDIKKPEYVDGDHVERVEFRFHHGVVNQFAFGTPEMSEFQKEPSFKNLHAHLNGLWAYAMKNFRLQHSYRYVDPIWQLLMEDVTFNQYECAFLYRREYKAPSINTRRNIAFFLGNFLRVAARKRLTADFVTKSILAMGVEAEIANYFDLPLYGSDYAVYLALFEFVNKRMSEHILDGVAA